MKTVKVFGSWVKCYDCRKLVGKLRIVDTDQPAAYISHFNVVAEYRRQFFGTYLLTAAIEYAQQVGCTAVALHCSISNVDALRLYKKHGFFIAGTTTKAQYSNETGIVERNYYLVKQIDNEKET